MKKLIITLIIMTCSFSMLIAQRDNKTTSATQSSNPQRDHDFVKKAMEAGISQIQLGKLAQSRSGSSEVREFANMMINDHMQMQEELANLAEQNAYMNMPATMPVNVQKEHDKLSGKSNADFDKAFVAQIVADHEKNIQLFRNQAEKGKDMLLKEWAAKTLSVLEQHLEHAKRLQKELKKS